MTQVQTPNEQQAIHTVCPQAVDTQTSYIMWDNADYAASICAPKISPYLPGSPSDRQWVRMYNRAATSPSGITPQGRRLVRFAAIIFAKARGEA